MIVAIGGSWCPNCHDEAPFLVELYKKYTKQGLEIVELSFEEEAQIKNPVRAAGVQQALRRRIHRADPGEPKELNDKVPQGVNLNSFPTTFFIGRDGRVRSAHAGFAGKASGKFHTELKEEVTALVERLLAEKNVRETSAVRSDRSRDADRRGPPDDLGSAPIRPLLRNPSRLRRPSARRSDRRGSGRRRRSARSCRSARPRRASAAPPGSTTSRSSCRRAPISRASLRAPRRDQHRSCRARPTTASARRCISPTRTATGSRSIAIARATEWPHRRRPAADGRGSGRSRRAARRRPAARTARRSAAGHGDRARAPARVAARRRASVSTSMLLGFELMQRYGPSALFVVGRRLSPSHRAEHVGWRRRATAARCDWPRAFRRDCFPTTPRVSAVVGRLRDGRHRSPSRSMVDCWHSRPVRTTPSCLQTPAF